MKKFHDLQPRYVWNWNSFRVHIYIHSSFSVASAYSFYIVIPHLIALVAVKTNIKQLKISASKCYANNSEIYSHIFCKIFALDCATFGFVWAHSSWYLLQWVNKENCNVSVSVSKNVYTVTASCILLVVFTLYAINSLKYKATKKSEI